MLTRINKIKSFGVFDNYEAAAATAVLSRFNVVYGENGSGKTTLSRLLGSLQIGEHKDYPSLEFSIETESSTLTQGRQYLRNVRVFNSDFVEASIGGFNGPLRHILILGEENKAVAEELKSEIVTRDTRTKRIQEHTSTVAKIESEKGKIFSKVAQTIGEATSGATLRTYRKPDALKAFQKLKDATPLSEKQLQVHRSTIRQEQLPVVGRVAVPGITQPGTGSTIGPVGAAHAIAERCRSLAARSAQSAAVARLASNPTISRWVEEGVHLHSMDGGSKCEFCDQKIPEARLQALANHFSAEDQGLKSEIENEREWVATVLDALDRYSLPNRLAIYSELRDEFDSAVEQFEEQLLALKKRVIVADSVLADKLARRTEAYEADIDTDAEALKNTLKTIADIMRRHDDKTQSFENEKAQARDAIEAHYLLSISEQVREAESKIQALTAESDLLIDGGDGLPDKRGLQEISESIIAKQAQISNQHRGGEELTSHLKQFLGRTDLIFESSEDGYVVLRRGKPARRLSEGEKTAIAFLYFLVQLKDQDFDIAEGVVVIDDPISSLDSSAIYQAFSFLKNATQNAKQLFVLTHNHEFLRLVLNWFQNLPSALKKQCSYSMVLCAETEAGRSARLAPLDQLLIDHATEYHYLFKVLHNFQSDGTILSCYHVPNIARKVLETFLDFHLPSNKSLYRKLEETDFDPHKKTAIYKFTNDLSHFTGKGFDPAIVAETQKNTAYLLEMIKQVAPLHYNGLKNLVTA